MQPGCIACQVWYRGQLSLHQGLFSAARVTSPGCVLAPSSTGLSAGYGEPLADIPYCRTTLPPWTVLWQLCGSIWVVTVNIASLVRVMHPGSNCVALGTSLPAVEHVAGQAQLTLDN